MKAVNFVGQSAKGEQRIEERQLWYTMEHRNTFQLLLELEPILVDMHANKQMN